MTRYVGLHILKLLYYQYAYIPEFLLHTLLYHLTLLTQVFQLIEAIEIVVRHHLEVSRVNSQPADTNHCKHIVEETLNSRPILEQWEQIAQSVPPQYETYSIELLCAIVTLWTTVRGHSFAKGWTMKFEKKYSKGIRKSLKASN